MRLIIGYLFMICLVQTKLPTARFQVSFKGVALQNNSLLLQNPILIDDGDESQFTKVDVDVQIDNTQTHLRGLVTCDMSQEHVNIVLNKGEQKETVSIKLVPGKSTEFYIEDYPLTSVDTNVNGCEVLLNSKKSSIVILDIIKLMFIVLFIQLNF